VVEEQQVEEASSPAKPHRPGFAASYPQSDELDALLAAFEAGNYRLVRRRAARLVETAEDDDVRRAADDLRRRLDPDRLTIFLFLLPLGLLLVLVVHYLLGTH
jgi:hypothetical protein